MSSVGWNELCKWRELVGLPAIEFDQEMADFAQSKANYRARNVLKDGHDGPECPSGWREGTGEAKAMWGWLTCVMEEDAAFGGTGMCMGEDGDRYMVLVLRGGTGEALIPRHNIPIHDTSYLTPNPPKVEPIFGQKCQICGEIDVLNGKPTHLISNNLISCPECATKSRGVLAISKKPLRY